MSVIITIQETTEAFLVIKFENKLYYFSLIIRLIANIYSVKFINNSQLMSDLTSQKHVSNSDAT